MAAMTYADPDTYFTDQGYTISETKQTQREVDQNDSTQAGPYTSVAIKSEDMKGIVAAASYILYFQDSSALYQPNTETKWGQIPWTKILHIESPSQAVDPEADPDADAQDALDGVWQDTVEIGERIVMKYSHGRIYKRIATALGDVAWQDMTGEMVESMYPQTKPDDPVWDENLQEWHPGEEEAENEGEGDE